MGEFPLNTSRQKASFQDQNCVMDIEVYDSIENFLSPIAGVKCSRCNGTSLVAGYKGIFNSKTRIHELEARFEWAY